MIPSLPASIIRYEYSCSIFLLLFSDKTRITWMSGEVGARGAQSSQGSCQDNNRIFVRKRNNTGDIVDWAGWGASWRPHTNSWCPLPPSTLRQARSSSHLRRLQAPPSEWHFKAISFRKFPQILSFLMTEFFMSRSSRRRNRIDLTIPNKTHWADVLCRVRCFISFK